MIDESKYKGCLKGLAIADSYGAPYEGGVIEQLLWRLIGKTIKGKKRYTDDTQMSLDIAHSFLENNEIRQNHLAQVFASSYKWSRGYGPSAAKILKGIKKGKPWHELNRRKFKEGSIGNGAAMRAPVVALCHPSNDGILKDYIQKSAEITHAHPLAIEGAHIIAVATCMALNDAPNETILETLLSVSTSSIYKSKLRKCIGYTESCNSVDPKEVKEQFGNGILASESCITALFFGLRYRESGLEQMLEGIFKLGGDTDTIGAMAGGIWGALNGDKKMAHLAKEVEDIDLIEHLAISLHCYHLTKGSN